MHIVMFKTNTTNPLKRAPGSIPAKQAAWEFINYRLREANPCEPETERELAMELN